MRLLSWMCSGEATEGARDEEREGIGSHLEKCEFIKIAIHKIGIYKIESRAYEKEH